MTQNTIELWRRVVDLRLIAAEATDGLRPPIEEKPLAGLKVLVVEDNADSREALCTMLAYAGLACHPAATGRVALALLDDVRPDIVILDVGLPEMDGLELARRIRTNPGHGHVPLIALTGYGQASDRRATAQAGFDYHLLKPVQPEELLALLAELGEAARTRDARPPEAATG